MFKNKDRAPNSDHPHYGRWFVIGAIASALLTPSHSIDHKSEQANKQPNIPVRPGEKGPVPLDPNVQAPNTGIRP
jgi:hypothetical protein